MPQRDYPWRVGRKVGRTIYIVYGPGEEALIGTMDSRALAQEAVQAHNARVTPAMLALLEEATRQHPDWETRLRRLEELHADE